MSDPIIRLGQGDYETVYPKEEPSVDHAAALANVLEELNALRQRERTNVKRAEQAERAMQRAQEEVVQLRQQLAGRQGEFVQLVEDLQRAQKTIDHYVEVIRGLRVVIRHEVAAECIAPAPVEPDHLQAERHSERCST